jgi:hypothetical protein
VALPPADESAVKQTSTVLANPQFPHWRYLGQNSELYSEIATMGFTYGYPYSILADALLIAIDVSTYIRKVSTKIRPHQYF